LKKSLGTEIRLIDEILLKGKSFKEEWIQESGVLLRLLRRRFRMTQAQLSKKSKVPQTSIANIESGKKKPTLQTIEKLLEAMGMRLALLPVCTKTADQLIREQAKSAAREKLHPVFGSMGLEDQLPSPKKMQEMVREETERLIESNTSRIWDE